MSQTTPQPPTLQDLTNAIGEVAAYQTQLQNALKEFIQHSTASKKFGKPQEYDGTRGEDA